MDIENILTNAKFENPAHREALRQKLFGGKIVELTDDQLQEVSAAGTPEQNWEATPPWLEPRHERPGQDPGRLLPDLPT